MLKAIVYQTRKVLGAMVAESDTDITTLSVDDDMTMDELLMQSQSGILDVTVMRLNNIETIALGAICITGLDVGFWSSLDKVKVHTTIDKKWRPETETEGRGCLFHQWNRAIECIYGWVEGTDAEKVPKSEQVLART